MKKLNFYKVISIATSALFLFLFYQVFFCSDSFVRDLGLQPSETTAILSRRTAVFMLGLSILLFCSRNLLHSKARQFLCLSTGITMLGLACMGSYEFMMKTVNTSMLQAITIEIALGLSLFFVYFKNKKIKTAS
jgi:hypothetical protein